MMQKYISKDELVKVVKEHIASIVGSGTIDILNSCLEMNNASFEDMFDDPQKIAKGLDIIFGNSSTIIKKEIIDVVYTTCKMKVNVDNFEDAIKDIRKLIKSLG